MIHLPRYLRLVLLLLMSFSLISCATKPITKNPLPFKLAAKVLANDLLNQVQMKTILKLPNSKVLVMDDFTDEDTGEFIAASEAIEKIIIAEAEKDFTSLSITKMNKENIHDANYLLNGVISLEQFDANNQTKNYHLLASVTDLNTGEVIANSATWVSDKNLDYAPLRESKEAPMYILDKRHTSKVKTARSLSGTVADDEYYKSLQTNALLAEAASAYGKGDYLHSIAMLNEASIRTDGQIMKTYAMLYQAHFKEGHIEASEEAFGKLVELSVQNNSLSVKLLFSVNSTDFIADKNLRSRYQIWLRQISKFFYSNKRCAKIIGHSSNSGTEEYNTRLSKQRADAVQRVMASDYKAIKHQTQTLGMGFKNNIKGLGTDDGRDAIDRRVEFSIIECSNLSS